MKRGHGAVEHCETGDMSAPKAAAQFLAGLLHGSAVEIAHLGIGSGKDQRQVLMSASGAVHPWGQQTGLIARALPPGTVMRGVTSSDRPGGMGADQARLMLWTSTPRQCRHYVACGKRPDGKWVIGAVSVRLRRRQPERVGRRPLRRSDPAADGADRRARREERELRRAALQLGRGARRRARV